MSVSLNGVAHSFGDRVLFSNISFGLGTAKYGLVGPNGVGKSTLARIIAGEIVPERGVVSRTSPVAYFSQGEDLPDVTLSEYLSDIWDARGEVLVKIQRLLMQIPLDRRMHELSGGERMRARLAKLYSRPRSFLVLDEPSNNLDRDGRIALLDFIESYEHGLLLISHDRELLGRVSSILELSNQGVEVYKGNFDVYWAAREKERAAAEDALQGLKRKRDDAIATAYERQQQQERRGRHGRLRAERRDASRFEAQGMKRAAQVTSAKIAVTVTDAADTASAEARSAWEELKQDPFLRLNFEGARVPADKIVLQAADLLWRFNGQESLWKNPLTFCVQGSERWRISGGNGSGKSTLLKLALSRVGSGLGQMTGKLKLGVSSVAYLDQGYGTLNPALSVIDNIEFTRFSRIELRNELAFYGLTGDKATRPVSTLSGGERLKASLAQMFLGKELPQLIVLDEPTNNLDLVSISLLERALQGFKGAVIVISHDEGFINNVGVSSELSLNP